MLWGRISSISDTTAASISLVIALMAWKSLTVCSATVRFMLSVRDAEETSVIQKAVSRTVQPALFLTGEADMSIY